MSSSPTRRPSTLAADRFTAAQRPWNAAPASREAARSEPAPMMGVGRSSVMEAPGMPTRLVSSASARSRATQTVTPYANTVRGAARPVAEPAPVRREETVAARTARERSDSVLVTSLVIAFVFVGLAIASFRLSGSMKLERSREQLSTTFARVYQKQGTFRAVNQRFATWAELAAHGARLGPSQRVIASNASVSHWYLAVRDTSTGITCSRTGELFDEGPEERQATCSGIGP